MFSKQSDFAKLKDQTNNLIPSVRTPLILDGGIKCNASLLPYTSGYVILQKNEKEAAPYWTESGGKVDNEDKALLDAFIANNSIKKSNHDLQEQILLKLLTQFTDPLMATFAYAALREAIEELCDDQSEFIYQSIISGAAELKYISRAGFNLGAAKVSTIRNEAFYLDFGNLPVSELITHFKASGNRDCREIVSAKISDFEITNVEGKDVTTFKGLPVGNSASLAKICCKLEHMRMHNRQKVALLFSFGLGVLGASLAVRSALRPSPQC